MCISGRDKRCPSSWSWLSWEGVVGRERIPCAGPILDLTTSLLILLSCCEPVSRALKRELDHSNLSKSLTFLNTQLSVLCYNNRQMNQRTKPLGKCVTMELCTESMTVQPYRFPALELLGTGAGYFLCAEEICLGGLGNKTVEARPRALTQYILLKRTSPGQEDESFCPFQPKQKSTLEEHWTRALWPRV